MAFKQFLKQNEQYDGGEHHFYNGDFIFVTLTKPSLWKLEVKGNKLLKITDPDMPSKENELTKLIQKFEKDLQRIMSK
jgi:hypothetical protein